MSSGISVVICCHDSAKRLPETLRHLARQEFSRDLPWEVVIVDNASRDDTGPTALACWPAGHPAPLRVVFEPKPGTGHARDRGMAEARYEIISFVDDDNWVPPDWVARVANFFDRHPDVTAMGGPSKGAFDGAPPPWFEMVAMPFAVGPQFEVDGDVSNLHGTLLWTTGMNLRKQAALDLFAKGFQFESRSTGQRGQDAELCFALRASGAKIYYDSTMMLQHYVPANRLKWSYALKHSFIGGENSPVFGLYTMSLGFYPLDKYPRWKQTWIFQVLKTVKDLIVSCLLHPIASFRQPEGSRHALRFQAILGQLSTLRKLRGHYAEVRDRIRTAAWVKSPHAR